LSFAITLSWWPLLHMISDISFLLSAISFRHCHYAAIFSPSRLRWLIAGFRFRAIIYASYYASDLIIDIFITLSFSLPLRPLLIAVYAFHIIDYCHATGLIFRCHWFSHWCSDIDWDDISIIAIRWYQSLAEAEYIVFIIDFRGWYCRFRFH
jgi:hypothetical protein